MMPECNVTAVVSRVQMEVVHASLWLTIEVKEPEDLFHHRSAVIAFLQLARLASLTGRPELWLTVWSDRLIGQPRVEENCT